MDITISNLSKQFEQKDIFKNINMTFLEGKINCFMGPSGIGKTTLINILLGLTAPDSGEVQGMQGKRVTAVFQEERLIEHLDAIKNIKLVCDKTMPVSVIEQELEKVNLVDCQNKPVKNLSGGMRRRVAVVRAMLAVSDIIIMDEPLKGLDDALKKQVIEYVKQKSTGKTVIIVTHDLEEARLLNANIILFDKNTEGQG
ncbi:MAG: ATP-binding cassette domain-containing protein [Mobilitalea sp.]